MGGEAGRYIARPPRLTRHLIIFCSKAGVRAGLWLPARKLDDATILLNAGRLYSAVNRMYYAMFYEVVALLLTKGLQIYSPNTLLKI